MKLHVYVCVCERERDRERERQREKAEDFCVGSGYMAVSIYIHEYYV